MNKLITVISMTFAVASFGKTVTCTFDHQEGARDEQLIGSFDYTLSRGENVMHLSVHPTADGIRYEFSDRGLHWPKTDNGDLNPDYINNPRISEKHKGFNQYKGFDKIESNVALNNFQVLINDKGDARIPIRTNDGNHWEEVFTCEE